ncbi:hypothetical protein Tco_0222893 [Tanacetum coccineum]
MAQQPQQQVIPTDQLVTTKYQIIGRCNNYAMLQNIPFKQVPNTNGTFRFVINKKEITYTVDMFRATLKLPVETPKKPFILPATLEFIQPFIKIIGYQGHVDKVSAFYAKNLAQPWKTMFKVFSRCLTSRTSGHDQTKINILQIFHDVVNCVHVDYATLLWWDFLHCVKQKKDLIQYPRFTKLIIADLIEKFDSIPKRLEEDYHSIKDDVPLVSVYITRNVTVRGMLIHEFITDDIRATKEYKEYEKVFVRVNVPTIQPQPVKSTQGTNRTPRATRTPTLTADAAQNKRKSKEVVGESSTPRKSLKVTIKQKKLVSTSIPPPTIVQEKILEEDIEKMVDGKDEDSYASAFANSIFQDDEDTGTRIEPESHKENPKNIDDDDDDDDVNKEKKDDEKDDDNDNDDNDDHDDHALVRNQVLGSLEIRSDKMQTPIPSPYRSSRTDLSSDNTIFEELTANVSPTPATTIKDQSMSKPISNIRKMKEMSDNHNNLVPELTMAKTNELIKEAVSRMVNDAVKQDRELFANVVPELVSKEFIKLDLRAQAADLDMWDVLKKKFEKYFASASLGKGHDAHQDNVTPYKFLSNNFAVSV